MTCPFATLAPGCFHCNLDDIYKSSDGEGDIEISDKLIGSCRCPYHAIFSRCSIA